RIRSGAIHVSPLALGSHGRGCPPSTGTSQVSQDSPVVRTVYATREPFGENTGCILIVASLVSCTASPPGNCFTYTCPAVVNVNGPRMKARILPSAESDGFVAESGKAVICSI